jgi:hypothetical protein
MEDDLDDFLVKKNFVQRSIEKILDRNEIIEERAWSLGPRRKFLGHKFM